MRSIAAGLLGPSGKREEVFLRDESVARNDDNADDAVLEASSGFLPISRLPSPPTNSCDGRLSPVSTPFVSSSSSSETTEPSKAPLTGRFIGSKLKLAKFSCLPVDFEDRPSML